MTGPRSWLLIPALAWLGAAAAQERVIVTFAGDMTPAERDRAFIREGARRGRDLSTIQAVSAELPAGGAARLRQVAGVLNVTADRPVYEARFGRINKRPGGGGGGTPTGEQALTTIQRTWGNLVGDGQGVVVAVVDTGVKRDHEDLAGNVDQANTFTANDRWAQDGDDNGHGTHVSGTIGALRGNNVGVYGVAPRAGLLRVKVLGQNGGTISEVISGIEYVRNNGSPRARVINMSLGGPGDASKASTDPNSPNYDPFLVSVAGARADGIVVVCAAGNESDDAINHTPGGYAESFTVAACVWKDTSSGKGRFVTVMPADSPDYRYTNFGARVDLAAYGTSITSCWNDGAYNTISGTSMATPHVAGAVAHYLSKHPTATPAQVEAAILAAVAPVVGVDPARPVGAGLLRLTE